MEFLSSSADHGEEFHEHGETTHGHNLYRETVRVPLIVAPAGGGYAGPGVVTTRVSTLDIYPTMLKMAGVERPPKNEGLSVPRQAIPPRRASRNSSISGRRLKR